MISYRKPEFKLPAYLYHREMFFTTPSIQIFKNKSELINDIVKHSTDLEHRLEDLDNRIVDLETAVSPTRMKEDLVYINEDVSKSVDDIKTIYNDIKQLINIGYFVPSDEYVYV